MAALPSKELRQPARQVFHSSDDAQEQGSVTIINVADLTDPTDPQGRTYRQINAEKMHAIPIGALVELKTGERLRVMEHTRDCDQTPLYSIGIQDDDKERNRLKWERGYCESSLKVVTPITNTIEDIADSKDNQPTNKEELKFDHRMCRPETLAKVAEAILRLQYRDNHPEQKEFAALAKFISPEAYLQLTTLGRLVK